jgi:RNA polymerase sigma-70 factor (ECF subfamily)
LHSLPDIYRETFILGHAAAVLGITVSAVKVRLHRARLMMREQLAPVLRRGWLDRMLSFKGRRK